jgi:hypothetical protein
MYLRANSEVTMNMSGSEFDIDFFKYNSRLKGYSFRTLIWEKEFTLTVNKDNSLIFENLSEKLEAVCEPY